MLNNDVIIQNKIAKHYNKRYSGNGLMYHKYVVNKIMAPLSGRILDVGCGTGFISDCFPERDIIGIDPSVEMLKLNMHQCYEGIPR